MRSRLLPLLALAALLPSFLSAQVRSGTYVGNGVDNRSIYVGFQPSVLIVDMAEVTTTVPDESVIRTSTMIGDASKDLELPSALTADKIQSLDATGFTVGTHASVNGFGLTYHWVAFKAGVGTLKVGSYLGNGTDNTSVGGVGFQPEYVIVMPAIAQKTTHRSSAMPGDITYTFDGISFADAVQFLEPDGFQVGTDARVNAVGTTYHYAAWNASPGEVAVGVYTGNGIDGRNVTGLGFFPEEVLVVRSGLNAPVHKPASTGVGVDNALLFTSRLRETDNIQALLSDGFQVGLHNRVNSVTAPNQYYWVAFGPHTPQINYRSIGTAPNTSGTLNAIQGSVTVTDGTAAWQTANRGQGDRINIGGTDYTVDAVLSETQLRLTKPFAAASAAYGYVISRQFATLAAWEDCIDGPPGCLFFPVATSSLVADDRSEVGVLYKVSPFALTNDVVIDGATTDSIHTITLTANPANRHNGIPGAGVVIDAQNGPNEIQIRDDYVTLEWLEIVRVRGANGIAAIRLAGGPGPTNVLLQNLLIHDYYDPAPANDVSGIALSGTGGKSVTVRNTMIWDGDADGIQGDDATDTALIENVTIDDIRDLGHGIDNNSSTFTVRNTIATRSLAGDFTGSYGAGTANNVSSDNSAPGASPLLGVSAATLFVAPGANLHLKAGPNPAIDSGLNLAPSFMTDVDGQTRAANWDRGADEVGTITNSVNYRSIGTAADYALGTVSAVNGSAVVLGSGTAWVSSNRGQGDRLRIDGVDYMILDVASETELTLTTPFTGVSGSGKPYSIARQFPALQDWEDCISFSGPCFSFPAGSSNLIVDNRREVGVVYDDGSPYSDPLLISGAITDATHDIVLTATPANRHHGIPGAGVVINASAGGNSVEIWEGDVTIEWMEVRSSSANAIYVNGVGPSRLIVIRNNLIHDLSASGIRFWDSNVVAEVYNNIVFTMNRGIFFDVPPGRAEVLNNTVYGCFVTGFAAASGPSSTITLRNNIAHSNFADFTFPGTVNSASSHNLSGDPSALTHSPGGGSLGNVPLATVSFVNAPAGNLHLNPGSVAVNAGASLGTFNTDIDASLRTAPWDMGADEVSTTPFRTYHRSIGINPGILASSGTASVSLGSTTVTFSMPLPQNVGAGDQLALDPGGINEVFFVVSRSSNTQLTVEDPAANSHTNRPYAIRRAFNSLQAWETARQGDLVSQNRREIGIAYDDGDFNVGVDIDGSITDNVRFLRLTVAATDRHHGYAGTGVVVDGLDNPAGEILIEDDYTELEGLEVKRVRGASGSSAVKVRAVSVSLSQLLLHDSAVGARLSGAGAHSFTVRNSFIYDNDDEGIEGDELNDSALVENCTVFANAGKGIDDSVGTPFIVRNTIAMGNLGGDFAIPTGVQEHNLSSDASATGPGSLPSRLAADQFVSVAPGAEDLHLLSGADAVDSGLDLSGSFTSDIDVTVRPGGLGWDMGADELGGPVGAASFSAAANQSFSVGGPPTPAATLYVNDDPAYPTITAADDIRLRIPAGFNMRWDSSVTTVFIGGPAAARLSGTVKAYEDFDRTVVLDVLTDFAPGDSITVDNLWFWSFTAPSPADSLELEVSNDDVVSAVNDRTITVLPNLLPTISSDDHQVFTVGQSPTLALPFSITDGTTSAINPTNDIRVRIPAGVDMIWDSAISSITVAGPGTSHVSTAVTYEDLDRTLLITVSTSFSPGEHIVVSGPAFRDFIAPPASGNLVLDLGGPNDTDDKTLTVDAVSDVLFFTATATDAQVKLEWRTPPSLTCASVRIMARNDGFFPTGPGDGRLVGDLPCTPDTNDSIIDLFLTNDDLYWYAAFVDYGSGFTPGKFVKARPFDSTTGFVKWAYSTGATSMAPPGLRFKSGESYVYAVSNDRTLHSMRGGTTGGDWPANWTPYLLGGPAQARPPVVPFAVGGAMDGAAFLGSQDGSVYAIDATNGTEEWKRPIASMVQAAPAGLFLGFDPFDIILAGTRNGTAPNQLEALHVDTGAPVWSFDNSAAQMGDDKEIGIISGSASVVYATKRIYFASRIRGGAMGSDKTLWCVDVASGSPQRCWAKALGNIDGSPIVRGGVVYVGTNAGIVYAVDAGTGAIKWSFSLGDGPIKGFIFPKFGGSELFLSTSTKVWSLTDNGFTATVNWQVTSIPSPSTPLYVPGTTRLFVGSSDGHLYQLDITAPLPATPVMLGDGFSAVGVPTADVLKSMIYVGTDAGIVYGVRFPIF